MVVCLLLQPLVKKMRCQDELTTDHHLTLHMKLRRLPLYEWLAVLADSRGVDKIYLGVYGVLQLEDC